MQKSCSVWWILGVVWQAFHEFDMKEEVEGGCESGRSVRPVTFYILRYLKCIRSTARNIQVIRWMHGCVAFVTDACKGTDADSSISRLYLVHSSVWQGPPSVWHACWRSFPCRTSSYAAHFTPQRLFLNFTFVPVLELLTHVRLTLYQETKSTTEDYRALSSEPQISENFIHRI
jgi:hypothetical protein